MRGSSASWKLDFHYNRPVIKSQLTSRRYKGKREKRKDEIGKPVKVPDDG